jgi:hypothetical protein
LHIKGSVFKRRYGKQIYEFSNGKDLIKAVRGQATTIKDMKHLSFVRPILCFTRANLEEIKQDKAIGGVYVVSSKKLVNLLLELNKN